MAQAIELYGKALANLLGGEASGDTFAVDFLSDTIKCALATSSYSPNLDTHEVFSDVTNEVSGTGYTAGGATLGTKTIVYTAANSWGAPWAASTGYVIGDVVRPTTGNGHLYRCVVAGTSHSAEPTWGLVAQRETAEGAGAVRWTEMGRGMTQIDSADVSWAASTITARWGIVYKDTGTASTSPVLLLVDFDGNISTTAGTFLITVPALGWWQNFMTYRGA